VTAAAPEPDPPAPDALAPALWGWLKVLPALGLYGPAWLLAAAAALVVSGLAAGWRDMRAFADPDPDDDPSEEP
jgi:hypothetical protein